MSLYGDQATMIGSAVGGSEPVQPIHVTNNAALSEWHIPEGGIETLKGVHTSTLADIAQLPFWVGCANLQPSVIYQGSCCSTSLLSLGITKLLDFNPCDKCEMVSVSFEIIIGVSLNAGEAGDLFICL